MKKGIPLIVLSILLCSGQNALANDEEGKIESIRTFSAIFSGVSGSQGFTNITTVHFKPNTGTVAGCNGDEKGNALLNIGPDSKNLLATALSAYTTGRTVRIGTWNSTVTYSTNGECTLASLEVLPN